MSATARDSSADHLIVTLQHKIDEVIAPQLRGVRNFALVDFPDHPNVGDSAIWLGETLYLKEKLGHSPAYVCTCETWSKDEFIEAVPDGPIFIHGGGNFGDLWPKHQAFREMLISSFPDRLIVQLPQTVHFSSKSNLEKSKRIINAHKNVTMLVRDLRSLGEVQESFASAVQLCPDMAFCLGRQRVPSSIGRDLLLLLRTDHEAVKHEESIQLPGSCAVEDWLFERRGIGKRMILKTWANMLLSPDKKVVSRIDRRFEWFQNLASNRVDRGLRQLGSARYVVTDRLHAHILCTLLDVPHTVVDNNYGKIGGFVESWTHSFAKLVGPVPSLAQALDIYVHSLMGNTA
ncbi:polysaccharide pyruvyl transferase family protein [Bradyrhizobium glycinis]|uniref:polysaccharide pyruvyl transferase family protein n=1 Tax=Bradyrhizobium glycinis TaxID=2751812 RepID=UPI0018D740CD|nr:polysaccharide pyruvyl transferase family protein [Bradyrhizobium glycinis]MBH5368996.1 polysaccharide pyruvyl transferase family protein [Bradyrhizobium glycinis]